MCFCGGGLVCVMLCVGIVLDLKGLDLGLLDLHLLDLHLGVDEYGQKKITQIFEFLVFCVVIYDFI